MSDLIDDYTLLPDLNMTLVQTIKYGPYCPDPILYRGFKRRFTLGPETTHEEMFRIYAILGLPKTFSFKTFTMEIIKLCLKMESNPPDFDFDDQMEWFCQEPDNSIEIKDPSEIPLDGIRMGAKQSHRFINWVIGFAYRLYLPIKDISRRKDYNVLPEFHELDINGKQFKYPNNYLDAKHIETVSDHLKTMGLRLKFTQKIEEGQVMFDIDLLENSIQK